jgi:hypothetical protein
MANCNKCGSYITSYGCACTTSNGCPIQLDFSCVLYHKDNNEISELDGLALTNGSTLELVIEALDEKIKQLDVNSWNLPYLRSIYTVNNLSQFGEAVDTELNEIRDEIVTLTGLVNLPITPNDSASINLTVSGVNDHTLRADLTLSATSGNQASILLDGVYVTPQTLSADYINKTISISDGNTINLTSLCGCEDCNPYLGAVASDPTTPDEGKYWYNTTSNLLKIQVNGLVKVITTT